MMPGDTISLTELHLESGSGGCSSGVVEVTCYLSQQPPHPKNRHCFHVTVSGVTLCVRLTDNKITSTLHVICRHTHSR